MIRTDTGTSQLSRVESFQYPNAHLGHLSEAQQGALDNFRTLCEKEGYYKPAGPGGVPEASHDDATLLLVSLSALSEALAEQT